MLLPIVAGVGLSVATTFVHCALLGPLRWAVKHPWLVKPGRHPAWQLTGGMGAATVLLMMAHMLEGLVWAVLYYAVGLAQGWDEAYYDALLAMTSLGFKPTTSLGDWRVLEPLATLNGILLAGLSAAMMFAILNLIAQRAKP